MAKASLYSFRLVVADSEALSHFYCDVFGMKVVRRIDASAAADPHFEIFLSTGLEGNNNQISLMHYSNKPAPTPGEAAISFVVEDVDAMLAAAQAAGGSVIMAAETLEDYKFRYAIIADPEGHTIDVMQPLSE